MDSLVVQDPRQRPEDQYFAKQDPSTLWAFKDTSAGDGSHTYVKKYSDRLLTTFRLPIYGSKQDADASYQIGYYIERTNEDGTTTTFSGKQLIDIVEDEYVLIDERLAGEVAATGGFNAADKEYWTNKNMNKIAEEAIMQKPQADGEWLMDYSVRSILRHRMENQTPWELDRWELLSSYNDLNGLRQAFDNMDWASLSEKDFFGKVVLLISLFTPS